MPLTSDVRALADHRLSPPRQAKASRRSCCRRSATPRARAHSQLAGVARPRIILRRAHGRGRQRALAMRHVAPAIQDRRGQRECLRAARCSGTFSVTVLIDTADPAGTFFLGALREILIGRDEPDVDGPPRTSPTAKTFSSSTFNSFGCTADPYRRSRRETPCPGARLR